MSLRPPAANEPRLQAVLRAGRAAWVGTSKRTLDAATATDALRPPKLYFGYYEEMNEDSVNNILRQRPLDRDGQLWLDARPASAAETRPARGEVLAQLNGGAESKFNFSNNCYWVDSFDHFKETVRTGGALAVVFTAEGEVLAMTSLILESSVEKWRQGAKRLQDSLLLGETARLASLAERQNVDFHIYHACSSGGFEGTRPDGSPAWRGVMRFLLSEMAHVIRVLYSEEADDDEKIPDHLFVFTLSALPGTEAKWERLGFATFKSDVILTSGLTPYYRPVFGPDASRFPLPTPKFSTTHL